MQGLFDFIFIASGSLLAWLLFIVATFILFSARHRARHSMTRNNATINYPLVTVIVPCYNESKVLSNCLASLLDQAYPNYEIIVVDDGSTDGSYEIAKSHEQDENPKITVLSKSNGGKASALNLGIANAVGEIIVSIDADSIFLTDTIEELASSFRDPEIAAVAGNVKVANRKGILNRQQALEYVTGLSLQRQAFAQMGCIQVISGAIGAFRKTALQEIGGYSSDTIVEDMDVTIALDSRGYRIVYNPNAIAYTEAPESLNDFMKQRFRWIYGSFQVLSKYKYSLWEPSAKSMGVIGLPYFLIAPWIQVIISILFFVNVGFAIWTGNLDELALIIILVSSVHVATIIYAVLSDREEKRLIIDALLNCFVYYHILSYATLKAGVNYARKHSPAWDKLERHGKNKDPKKAAIG